MTLQTIECLPDTFVTIVDIEENVLASPSAPPVSVPSIADVRDEQDSDSTDLLPDGGYGWICVLCSFVVHFFALGCVDHSPDVDTRILNRVCSIESSWGVYQSHYFTSKVLGHVSSSDLAWVGSIQATGQPLVGM